MNNRLKKAITGVLCLALLLCASCAMSVSSQAATVHKGAGSIKTTYKLSELELAGTANGTVTVKNTGSAVSFGYDTQYGQAYYAIPAEILRAGLIGFECTFGSGSADYSLKLIGTSEGFQDICATYGQTVVTTADLDTANGAKASDIANIQNIAVMNIRNGSNSFTVESVTFLLKDLSNDEDINLKDAMTSVMGSDFIVGAAVYGGDLSDARLMQLVTQHFNAITFGNELKPDCMFGYAGSCPGKHTETFNGKELLVPRLSYANAERMLNYIYDWNQNHPDNQLKVRGHVLVWHSQTPEWFFHEDYDVKKPYVDAATMSLREEWYIKSVAEHFTGKDSKYKDLFYAWDVVNEAVSDWPGGYRKDTDGSPSSWWAVFKSNKFITDAFVFANKYMPKNIELYYNDYGDCSPKKSQDIVTLLKAVKSTPGARIDGMGMQAHYSANDPSGEDFKKAVRAYCAVVDHVQITEMDFTASSSYDGTSKTQAAEDVRTAARYKEIYDAVKSLKAEGKRVTGLTVWGTIDSTSWLAAPRCPLLFDNNYKPKRAFYALAEMDAESTAIAISGSVSGTVTVKKDSNGNMLSAAANIVNEVSGSKAVISGELVSQVKKAAGTDQVDITMSVLDSEGNVRYQLKVNTADLVSGSQLKIYKTNLTGYEMVNSKKYKVGTAGNVTVSMSENAVYELVSEAQASEINTRIKASIEPKQSAVTLSKGSSTEFALGSQANLESIKSISYSSNKAKVSVDANGRITGLKKGNAKVKAVVSLKNGGKKTIKMKVTVK